MGRGAVMVAGICAGLACTHTSSAETQTPASDSAARLQLFAAAFAKDDAPPPSPHNVTAMAFLPGRGVVSWDVTGLTPAEAREAEIEAMGLADARAVQREIDAADTEKRAELEREAAQSRVLAGGAQRAALAMPAFPRPSRAVAGLAPLGHVTQGGNPLGVRNGETLHGQPRIYAFAAASGRGVGYNVAHEDVGWKNAGLTVDQGGFSGQRQAGLAWRKGPVQTSVSYVQQKDRMEILGVQTDKDHRLMLTATLPPQAILGLFAKAH